MWKLHLLLVALCLGATVGFGQFKIKAEKPQVCVVGAGVAGLSSAKQLAEYSNEFDIVVFERNAEVGGTWLYSDFTDVDDNNVPIYSNMYKYLRTNLPKDIMTYPDYRNFSDPEGRSCVTHETVLSYLKNYTEHFNLRQYIQFNTFVEKVTPIPVGSDWHDTQYLIRSKNLDTNQVSETTCNAVMVCNGHFSTPKIPEIPGIETFPGKVIHSKNYRKPEKYKNQVVAILGASYSGTDIALEIAKYAKTVYLSHNKDKIEGLPKNIKQVAGVVRANNSNFILKDNSSIKADAFIFCTGYNFSFPFLDETSKITVDDNNVLPIYKHLINIEHPKMSFVGLPLMIANFPIIYAQAKYTVAVLRGKVQLPSKSVMMLDTKLPEGTKNRDAHGLSSKQWEYADQLALEAGFEPLPRWYSEAVSKWSAVRSADPWHFKENNLYISENGTVTISKPAKGLWKSTKAKFFNASKFIKEGFQEIISKLH